MNELTAQIKIDGVLPSHGRANGVIFGVRSPKTGALSTPDVGVSSSRELRSLYTPHFGVM